MATIVNVQDPSTLNNLAIDSSGHIGINNFPGVQTITGTVNVAFFPAIQTVNGTVDVSDRSARQLGIVTVASGTIGTNTAPAYNIIQDGTTNANKLKVNSDGSINTLITTESIVIGSVELVDSGGVNKLTINSAGQAQTEDIEQAGYIAATSPPATTNAGSDTPYTFSAQVNRIILMNNTSANVNYAFDAVASAGSLVLTPGSMLVYPKKCTALHLYTAAAQNINGTAAANIVVLGAL